MQLLDGEILFSATDLRRFSQCAHLAELDRLATLGELAAPTRSNELAELLARHGIAHEASYLDSLKVAGTPVVEIELDSRTIEGLREGHRQTVDAMRGGAEMIYQASFLDVPWRGQADFVRKVDGASDLGPWSYEAVDTKLHAKPTALDWLQLGLYSQMIGRVQGRLPDWMHVVVRDGSTATVEVAEHVERLAELQSQLIEFVSSAGTSDPEPNPGCDYCRWYERCAGEWETADHLLLAHVDARTRPKLAAVGVTTVAGLAGLAADAEVDGIAPLTLKRLRSNARLLQHERSTGEPHLRLRYPREGKGLDALPASSEGDLYFDIEGFQFAETGPLEYLFGFHDPTGARFHAFWAHSPEEERTAFEQAVDLMVATRAEHPEMHVFHYNTYEPASLRRLSARHDTRQSEVEALRSGVLVDLLTVARYAVTTSSLSWSLKSLEKFYREGREGAVTEAAGSMVTYDRWRSTQDATLLESLEAYNKLDCESLAELKEWLDDLARDRGVASSELEPIEEELLAEPDAVQRLRQAVALLHADHDESVGRVIRRTLVELDFTEGELAGAVVEILRSAEIDPEDALVRGKKELGIPIARSVLAAKRRR